MGEVSVVIFLYVTRQKFYVEGALRRSKVGPRLAQVCE